MKIHANLEEFPGLKFESFPEMQLLGFQRIRITCPNGFVLSVVKERHAYGYEIAILDSSGSFCTTDHLGCVDDIMQGLEEVEVYEILKKVYKLASMETEVLCHDQRLLEDRKV